MAIKKGDILDERKRFPDSCGLVVKVAGGGEGFQKIFCCGHELTEDDVVPTSPNQSECRTVRCPAPRSRSLHSSAMISPMRSPASPARSMTPHTEMHSYSLVNR